MYVAAHLAPSAVAARASSSLPATRLSAIGQRPCDHAASALANACAR